MNRQVFCYQPFFRLRYNINQQIATHKKSENAGKVHKHDNDGFGNNEF